MMPGWWELHFKGLTTFMVFHNYSKTTLSYFCGHCVCIIKGNLVTQQIRFWLLCVWLYVKNRYQSIVTLHITLYNSNQIWQYGIFDINRNMMLNRYRWHRYRGVNAFIIAKAHDIGKQFSRYIYEYCCFSIEYIRNFIAPSNPLDISNIFTCCAFSHVKLHLMYFTDPQ